MFLNKPLQGFASDGLNKNVGIQKGVTQSFGKQDPDGALANSRHSNQYNIFLFIHLNLAHFDQIPNLLLNMTFFLESRLIPHRGGVEYQCFVNVFP